MHSRYTKEHGRAVIITQGHEAVITARKGKASVYNVPSVSPHNIVDLNGAGDAFVGGFLSQMAVHQPMDVCINAACYAAQYIIQQNGCSFAGNPTFDNGQYSTH